MLKHSIEEKLLQKEELKVFYYTNRIVIYWLYFLFVQHLEEECGECNERLKQILIRLDENHIDDSQIIIITSDTKRKCEELTKNIQVNFNTRHRIDICY
jgi:hypothetical protein